MAEDVVVYRVVQPTLVLHLPIDPRDVTPGEQRIELTGRDERSRLCAIKRPAKAALLAPPIASVRLRVR